MKVILTILTLFILNSSFAVSNLGSANDDSLDNSVSLRRQKQCKIIGLGGITLTHAALYQLWYKGNPSSNFHFINDNQDWMQMDKFGHMYSSYYLGLLGLEAAKWSGVPKNKQWKWALFGSLFQDPIEIWDGFSSAWGASLGDLAANSLGTVIAAGQHALWQEQKVKIKMSYTASDYHQIRPNILGSNFNERLLKDYNAQTYWLTWAPKRDKKPLFLGLALGYGANGLLGGNDNIWEDKNGQRFDYSHIKRYRQIYLGLDFNFQSIKTNKKALKILFFILDGIKLPSPALEYNKNGFKGHWLNF